MIEKLRAYITAIGNIILMCMPLFMYCQDYNRANIWYFGVEAGVDFNSGQATAIYNGQVAYGGIWRGPSVMCDTNGDLLFYTQGNRIWDRNHNFIDPTFLPVSYDIVSFPIPGSNEKYYVFAAPGFNPPHSFGKTYYAIIDMELNAGLGGVSDTFRLESAWDAGHKIAAVKHDNKEDIWVIYRMMSRNKYAAFLITKDSVHTQPVLSDAPDYTYYNFLQLDGQLKVSYNKKYLLYSFAGGVPNVNDDDIIEICRFNSKTGQISFLYTIQIKDSNLPSAHRLNGGVEFSPDSKFAYISANKSNTDSGFLYQYDMRYIEDSVGFNQSRVLVGSGKRLEGMQLGRDGKIYISADHAATNNTPYLSIIHKPGELGTNCNFENIGLVLSPKVGHSKLTNELLDYLYRFDYYGNCEGDIFNFDPWFIPEPTFIEWNFGDPLSGVSNTSTIPHATHKFTDGGTYEVSVYVEYPSGRIEETSREVKVEYAPEPDLGPDTSFCVSSGITLDAECGPHSYFWSTGAIGSPQIIVYDTGWYWVRVENDAGCFEIDSIHLELYPPAIADTSALEVKPTTCGGSTGVIRGLLVNGLQPLSWYWLDDLGDTVSTSLDIYHLLVGNYTLEVLDGNGCITEFGPYHIHDAGEVLIDSLVYSLEHCSQQDASISVHAVSGLGDMLFYSIDNGANYYANEGIFTGLSAGSYAVRVRDSTDCQDVYVNNPVIIDNMDAPEITSVNVGACTQGQSNGSIEITAIGGGDTLYYSNDNGLTFQVNDGSFYDLLAGFYTCVVMDEVGCDTTFIVEVPEEITLRLQTVAGEDEVCPGNTAFVPLYVSNFNDVGYFRTTLLYDKSVITCTGYANTHAQIEDSLEVMLFPAEGKVELLWHAPSVTLPANTVLADLVFESLDPGLSMVAWDGSAGASLFLNSTGLTIPVDYFLGSVRIYEEVFFTLEPQLEACQGDNVEIIPMLWTSNSPVSYLWTDPYGNTFLEDTLQLNNIQEDDSGTYSLKVTDTLDCYSDANIIITVHPTPIPAFAGQDTIVMEEPLELDAGDYIGFLWNTGETQRYITAEYNDWYSVVIESALGCFGQDSVYVFFLEPIPEPIQPEIYLPNAFTPDGDGLNDDFKVINPPDNIESFAMYIYNRWGQKVFETKDITHGWDGTFQGKASPSGTYVYRIEYSIAAYDFDTNGTVVLVR